MSTRPHRSALAALAAAFAISTGGVSCFVSIDESKIAQGQQPGQDAGDQDADASVTGDADAANDQSATEAEAAADAHDDVTADAPDAGEASWPEASTDGDTDAADDADAEPVDSGWLDAPLVECQSDFDCPPVGCTLRTCDNNVCKDSAALKQDVGTFELPAPLSCTQGYNSGCVVAARSYLVALTPTGIVAFNTRNPKSVRQETIDNTSLGGYSYLLRSGDRIWTSRYTGAGVPVAWLDVPPDGVSPFSPPAFANLLTPAATAYFPAPNDALLLYSFDGATGYFARYSPGIPTSIPTFAAAGSAETEVVGSSANRALLHNLVDLGGSPSTFTHRFSLQSDTTSTASSNSGSYQETTFNSYTANYGFFAQSREGSIAWLVALHDGGQWRDVRVYWLLSGASEPISSTFATIEQFTTPPPSTPEGPIAFVSEDTIAAAVISGGASPSPYLDVVKKSGTNAPSLVKRIPLSLSPGALSIAGDAGYAYVVTGTTVHIFAPACMP